MIKPTALALALAVGFAPAAGLAHTPYLLRLFGSAPGPRKSSPFAHAAHPREARIARPTFGQVPPEDQNIPAISRDPNDCIKTMCTCLAGGGC